MVTNEQISEVLKEGVESYLSYGGLLAKCLRKIDRFIKNPDCDYSETINVIEFEVPFDKDAMTAIKNKLVAKRDEIFISVLDKVGTVVNLKDFTEDSFEAFRYELEIYRNLCGKFLMNRDDSSNRELTAHATRYTPIHQSELHKEGYIGDKMYSMLITSPEFIETCPIPSNTMYALPDTEYTGWYLSDLAISMDKNIVKVKNEIYIVFPKHFSQRSIYPVIKGVVTGEEYVGNYKKYKKEVVQLQNVVVLTNSY